MSIVPVRCNPLQTTAPVSLFNRESPRHHPTTSLCSLLSPRVSRGPVCCPSFTDTIVSLYLRHQPHRYIPSSSSAPVHFFLIRPLPTRAPTRKCGCGLRMMFSPRHWFRARSHPSHMAHAFVVRLPPSLSSTAAFQPDTPSNYQSNVQRSTVVLNLSEIPFFRLRKRPIPGREPRTPPRRSGSLKRHLPSRSALFLCAIAPPRTPAGVNYVVSRLVSIFHVARMLPGETSCEGQPVCRTISRAFGAHVLSL